MDITRIPYENVIIDINSIFEYGKVCLHDDGYMCKRRLEKIASVLNSHHLTLNEFLAIINDNPKLIKNKSWISECDVANE